jgi:uncharacterized integral membrane protein
MRVVLRVLSVVLLLGLGVALIAQNREQSIPVHLVIVTFEQVPVWQALLISLLVGAGATALACAWPLTRYRLRLRRARQRMAELEQEVHGLRTLPLGEDDAEDAAQARAE